MPLKRESSELWSASTLCGCCKASLSSILGHTGNDFDKAAALPDIQMGLIV